MSDPTYAYPPSKRLDVLMKSGHVKEGTRFLYTVNGAGKTYEGMLFELSPSKDFVRLNESIVWDYPPEIFVEEIFPAPHPDPLPVGRGEGVNDTLATPTPVTQAEPPTTTKTTSKRHRQP